MGNQDQNLTHTSSLLLCLPISLLMEVDSGAFFDDSCSFTLVSNFSNVFLTLIGTFSSILGDISL